MRPPIFLLLLAGLGLTCAAQAQPPARPPGQQAPPLMACGAHGNIDILCGTHSPEDLELTPDGKYLIVSQFVNRGNGAGLALFDLANKTYHNIPITAEPLKDWGDSTCPGPIGEALKPHGISLSKRANGTMQLYVVNHGGRESIEMFELKPAAGSWGLVWHGCAVSKSGKDFNDVAAMKDGGFIATLPTVLRAPGDRTDLFKGAPSGYVVRWSPEKGETELPGTRAAYPNGVLVSTDSRYMYFNAWTALEVHKYDLKQEKETGVVKLDFLPDNITWTKDHHLLAAGVKGVRGNCPAGSSTPCVQAFGVAEINPANMKAKDIFNSEDKGALIPGASVALQVGKSIYVGAFQGDRLLRISD